MRKTATVVIDAPGRDHGRCYLLREMPASQAEKWAVRVFLALSRSGVAIPDDVAASGMAGIALLGMQLFAGIKFEDAEPLLDEMFGCISYIPDPAKPNVVRGLIEDDIEEVATRLRLRKEVFGLHVDFSQAGGLLTSALGLSASPAAGASAT